MFKLIRNKRRERLIAILKSYQVDLLSNSLANQTSIPNVGCGKLTPWSTPQKQNSAHCSTNHLDRSTRYVKARSRESETRYKLK